jgi:citrate lyase beta subunit
MKKSFSHVVYGGAHLFSQRTPQKLGELATAAWEKLARSDEDLHASFGSRSPEVYARAEKKLRAAPVSDIRIDFEDGYGVRAEEEEKKDAARTGKELAAVPTTPGGPAFGVRIRAIRPGTSERALSVIDAFCTNLLEAGGKLPHDFVVTLPKVRNKAEVAALESRLATLENRLGLPRIGMELMAETRESASAAELASWIQAGAGRVRSLHLGAYDFLSELGVLARSHRLHHPYTDALRTAMKLATADTDVDVFDGATTLLPIDTQKKKDGAPLTEKEAQENRLRVHAAFSAHVTDVAQSLDKGFMGSWILYPAQLVSHAVAQASFYVDELASSRARLGNFVAEASRASAVGTSFDDRATARGLVSFFARGLVSGVLTASDLGPLEPHEALIRAEDVDGLVAAFHARA